ncbi:hypothetical protein BDP27DRAFT_1364841 [Rhodocollybia butyracea]|uniref:Uncharacterized protein n=1 Tax=Rhodocollybia butyracea TaxID=206335 RepID=A0A9P5U576_9AGAR|nr:hypothetical protein BDP27DRAFT_1364841 [Rhodocollybia butyracea]
MVLEVFLSPAWLCQVSTGLRNEPFLRVPYGYPVGAKLALVSILFLPNGYWLGPTSSRSDVPYTVKIRVPAVPYTCRIPYRIDQFWPILPAVTVYGYGGDPKCLDQDPQQSIY